MLTDSYTKYHHGKIEQNSSHEKWHLTVMVTSAEVIET